jgi:hypothetical protein
MRGDGACGRPCPGASGSVLARKGRKLARNSRRAGRGDAKSFGERTVALVNRMLSAALVVATLAGVNDARAVSYSYQLVGSDGLIIRAKGTIASDEVKIFNAWSETRVPKAARQRPNRAIVFDTGGGNTEGAFALGALIHKVGFNTGVAANGTCASACVVIWAAGVRKSASATSHIGVHGASMDQNKLSAREKQTAPLYESLSTLKIAQQLHLYGAPDKVVVQTIMTPSNDMYWLTAEDAAAWEVNVVPPPAAAE